MPLGEPRDSTIAVVGDGFGSLLVFATARYLGFRPEDVTIYGTSGSPIATYQQFAFNLGQTVLRSESESHFLPADWPTFGELDAWARRNPAYLFRSVMRRYNPGVPDILAQATAVARRLGWEDSRFPARVEWLQRESDPEPHFVMFDGDANYIGRARHVMLALGHGPLSFPSVLAKARDDPQLGARVVQAYEPKTYATGGRYVVVGAGIASVNEWANALDAGAYVLSLLRRPAPEEQDLNTPRCLFEALGIDAFQGQSFEDRVAFLGKILKGTAPQRRGWAAKIQQGQREGRFAELIGEIDQIEAGPLGLRVHISSSYGPAPGWLDITGVVAGTGFEKSVLAIPLLRRLVQHYGVPVQDGRFKLRTNCGLPPLDVDESRLCTMGLLANVVVPHGDTIAGLKYIARRFVSDCARAERLRGRGVLSRLRMQLSLSGEATRWIRRARQVEQLS